MAEYRKPLPQPEVAELTRPFWEAAKRHELVIPRCRRCNRYFWYPRQECPTCLQRETWEWERASGRARLYTFNVVRQPQHPAFNEDVPYILAVVQLEEGPRMLTNVIGCPVEEVQVDMPLTVAFDEVTPEWTLVKFRPA